MAQFTAGEALTLVLSAIGVVVWLVRLEGRVNTQDRMHAELKGHVEYIRDRIDEALRK